MKLKIDIKLGNKISFYIVDREKNAERDLQHLFLEYAIVGINVWCYMRPTDEHRSCSAG